VEMSFGVVDEVNNLVRSIALADVRSGVPGWLKTWTILCVRSRRADTVEWLGSKPCWFGERRSELSSGCRRCSRTLTAGKRKGM